MKNNFFSYSFIVCSKGDYVMHRFTLIFYLAEFQCNMRQWACLKGIWHLWVFGTARWRMPSGITCENLLLESWAIYQYKILKGVIYPLNFDGWSPLLRGTTINDLGGRRKSRKKISHSPSPGKIIYDLSHPDQSNDTKSRKTIETPT